MKSTKSKLKILFLCTGNSCRSQMAEGFARHLKGDIIEPYSAGVIASGMNPLTVHVMKEAGVDISSQLSEEMDGYIGRKFDYVITLCDNAKRHCPVFPGAEKTVHHPFKDPLTLGEMAGTNEEAIDIYRRIRDEIKAFVMGIPGNL